MTTAILWPMGLWKYWIGRFWEIFHLPFSILCNFSNFFGLLPNACSNMSQFVGMTARQVIEWIVWMIPHQTVMERPGNQIREMQVPNEIPNWLLNTFGHMISSTWEKRAKLPLKHRDAHFQVFATLKRIPECHWRDGGRGGWGGRGGGGGGQGGGRRLAGFGGNESWERQKEIQKEGWLMTYEDDLSTNNCS